MSEMAKAARAAMKNKAKRLGTTDPSKKVDASSWSPPEPLNTEAKTGLRPLSRRAYKKGGKVEGAVAKMHAGRKPRKSGGEASMYANAKINRNVKDANEEREGIKHVGGMKKGGRAKKNNGGAHNGLFEGNRPVVSKAASKVIEYNKNSDYRANEKPAPAQKDEGMTAEEAKKFMESRKRGGRTKKAIGGAFGQYLSPALMLMNALRGDKDEKKSGGRIKKQMGGMLPGDPRLDIVKRQAMNFQGNPVTPGAKKGGKIERHPDEAMDKALIKQMVKKEARTGKAHGGTKRMNRKDGGMALDGEIQGTRPTGGRLARANGGSDRDAGKARKAARDASFGARRLTDLLAAQEKYGPRPARTAAINTLQKNPNMTREQFGDALDAARPVRDQARQAPNRSSNDNPGRNRPAPAPAPAPAAPVPAAAMMDTRGGSPMQGGTMGPGNARPLPGGFLQNGGVYGQPQTGGGLPLPQSFGYGNDMLYPGQMPPGAMPPQTGGGYPLPQAVPAGMGNPYMPTPGPAPMAQQNPAQPSGQYMSQMQPQAAQAPGAGLQQAMQPQQAQAAPAAAPAQAFKRGGRAKGKTDINIVISAGPKGGPAMPPGMMPPPGPPMVPPPPPQMGAGGPPGGAPPMPPGPPMGMPMGGPPGMPPGMGMPRKSGGRITPKAKSFADMKAGAGSGEGRLQKTDIAEYKRGQHRAGGKVYRSYEDMDAGAGSGLGRLEKTEIQSRKR